MRFYEIYRDGSYIRFILARSKKQVKQFIIMTYGNTDGFEIKHK